MRFRVVFLFLISVLLSALPLRAGKKGTGEPPLGISSCEIVKAGDSLRVRVFWHVGADKFPKSGTALHMPMLKSTSSKDHVVLRPVIRLGSYSVWMRPVGMDENITGERILYDVEPGTDYMYEDVFPFEEWMEDVQVCDYTTVPKRGGKVLAITDSSKFGPLSRPIRPTDPVFGWTPLVPRDTPDETRTIVREFIYEANAQTGKVTPSLGDNGVFYDSMAELLRPFTYSKDYSVSSVMVELFVPPEAKETDAKARAQRYAGSVRANLRSEPYAGMFRMRAPQFIGKGSDWTLFRREADLSPLSEVSDMAEVYQAPTSDKRYKALAAMPDAMRKARDIFPKLFIARTTITCKAVRCDTREEFLSLCSKYPELSRVQDCYRIAMSYPEGSDERLDVLFVGHYAWPLNSALRLDLAMELARKGLFYAVAPLIRDDGGYDQQTTYIKGVCLFYSKQYNDSYETFLHLAQKNQDMYGWYIPMLVPFVNWSDEWIVWK